MAGGMGMNPGMGAYGGAYGGQLPAHTIMNHAKALLSFRASTSPLLLR